MLPSWPVQSKKGYFNLNIFNQKLRRLMNFRPSGRKWMDGWALMHIHILSTQSSFCQISPQVCQASRWRYSPHQQYVQYQRRAVSPVGELAENVVEYHFTHRYVTHIIILIGSDTFLAESLIPFVRTEAGRNCTSQTLCVTRTQWSF